MRSQDLREATTSPPPFDGLLSNRVQRVRRWSQLQHPSTARPQGDWPMLSTPLWGLAQANTQPHMHEFSTHSIIPVRYSGILAVS